MFPKKFEPAIPASKRPKTDNDKFNVVQCPCNYITYIKFNINLLLVFLFVNYLTSSLKMANR